MVPDAFASRGAYYAEDVTCCPVANDACAQEIRIPKASNHSFVAKQLVFQQKHAVRVGQGCLPYPWDQACEVLGRKCCCSPHTAYKRRGTGARGCCA